MERKEESKRVLGGECASSRMATDRKGGGGIDRDLYLHTTHNKEHIDPKMLR